jgi:hypothetical protein
VSLFLLAVVGPGLDEFSYRSLSWLVAAAVAFAAVAGGLWLACRVLQDDGRVASS